MVDFGSASDDWDSEYSIPSTVGLGTALLPMSVPMPTLYAAGEGNRIQFFIIKNYFRIRMKLIYIFYVI